MKKLLSRLLIFNPQFSIFQNGFIQHQLRRSGAGFTLIELIVVIAILGVLSVVLITVIDPLDKINAANDAGVISSIIQFGKANDSYATSHNNTYAVVPAAFSGATSTLADLVAAGEIKSTAYTPPTGYTVGQMFSPNPCTTSGPTFCTFYAVYTGTPGLLSKANIAKGRYYGWSNGKGCFRFSRLQLMVALVSNCP